MRMHEDKQLICTLLLRALQSTNYHKDLEALEYNGESDTVTAYYAAHGIYKQEREINVAMDSGFAMICDIVNNLDFG